MSTCVHLLDLTKAAMCPRSLTLALKSTATLAFEFTVYLFRYYMFSYSSHWLCVFSHMTRLTCFPMFDTGYISVRTGPGKPGKSWNFVLAFSRTGKSWKKATGPGKSWKSVKLE